MGIARFILFPLVLGFSIALYFIGNRPGDISTIIATEWRAMCARMDVRRVLARSGAQGARAFISMQYDAKLKLLSDDGRAIFSSLAHNPVALVDWLSRLPEPPGG